MSKEKAVRETAAPAKTAKKGDLMYLGPTVTGAAKRGTVFKDGILPKKAQECISELPQMSRLFVEMDRIPEASREIRKKQSALGAIYDQVAAHYSVQNERRV